MDFRWYMTIGLGIWLGGCGVDDGAETECRCTPETNKSLFPCPDMEVFERSVPSEAGDTSREIFWVLQKNSLPDGMKWISEIVGDTLSPESDWIVARGDTLLLRHSGTGNPFATQIPDCPSGQLLFLREPTRPENVLANVKSIFEASPTSRNLGQYMDQLTEDFTFVPDEDDIQLHPEVYDTRRDTLWGRDQERSFAQAVFDPQRIRIIRFLRWYRSSEDERVLSDDPRIETFLFPYEAEFVEEATEEGSSAVLAIKGWMEVDLVTPTVENPVWAIRQWRDRRDPATAKWSWGELRAEFAR